MTDQQNAAHCLTWEIKFYVRSTTTPKLQSQSEAVETEIIVPSRPKIFTVWPFKAMVTTQNYIAYECPEKLSP